VSEQRVAREIRADAPAPWGLWQTGVLAAALALLVFGLAFVIPGVHSRLGSPPAARHVSIGFGYVLLVLIAFGFLTLALLVSILKSGRIRNRSAIAIERPPVSHREMLPLYLLLLVVFATPIVAFVFLYQRKGSNTTTPTVPPHRHPGSPTHVEPTASTHGGGLGIHWLALAVLAGLALAALVVLVLRHRRSSVFTPSERAERLASAIEAGIDDLESERDPRRAVIKAYARMELALGEAGIARNPPEAPLEYLARALQHLHASGQSIAGLTSLFERAKFSKHAIDESMRGDALSALGQLSAELRGGR